MRIQEYLKHYKIITDGAFGTYYAERYETQDMPELANDEHKERVLEIHRAYIKAGAKLIRTNTFASNTVLLSAGMDAVKVNIREASELARKAASESEKRVYIAGDIGPIPMDGGIMDAEAQYYEIARTFAEEGIDILTFETFSDMERILPAIQKIKKERDMFIMVQFSVNQFGYSNAGLSAGKLIAEAAAVDEIDAVGFNCGVGPGHMQQIIHRISLNHGKYNIALPNAGYPKRIHNRMQFTDSPSYFVQKEMELADMGMDIVGGCCGTNPACIKKLAKELDILQRQGYTAEIPENRGISKVKQGGFFRNPDGTLKHKKLIAVELAPPVNANDEKLLEAAHILEKADVDVVTFPDSPSGRTRVDSVLMGAKVRMETGLEVMPHICCRDKNAIAMRSLLMGAKINDIRNMLVVTGDPIPELVRQTVKSVFNFDSVGLMKIIRDMNEEIFQDVPMVYGGAINQGRRNLDGEIGRVLRKMETGAEFFFTQPVFSKEDAERVQKIKEATGARILCGIMPLISKRNALFMKNEIAGIHVPDEIIERYPEKGTKEAGEAVGIDIAREVMAYMKDFADGYYFSFPFNKVYLLERILNGLDL